MIVQLVVYLPRTQIDLHFPRSAPQNKAFLFQAKQGAPFGLQVPTQMANSWVNTPVLELSDVIHSSLGHFLRGLANSSWWQTSYNFKVQVGSFTGKIWWSMIQNHPIFLIQPIHSNLTLFFSKKNETNHQPTIHTSHPHPKKRKKNAKKKTKLHGLLPGYPFQGYRLGRQQIRKALATQARPGRSFELYGSDVWDGRSGSPTGGCFCCVLSGGVS